MKPFSSLAKHFLNKAESLVVESLQGLASLNPSLGLDTTNKGKQEGATGCMRATDVELQSSTMLSTIGRKLPSSAVEVQAMSLLTQDMSASYFHARD